MNNRAAAGIFRYLRLLLVAAVAALPRARGQSASDGFDPNVNGGMEAMAVQADGKILVAGTFTTIGGVARNRIARLHHDGTLDAAFNPDANATVFDVAVQADGKIVIVGSFTTIGGVARSRIARLNADGTLDAAFDPNSNGLVLALAVQADGKIVLGGNMSSVGGVGTSRLARVNTNGTHDTTFTPNVTGVNVRTIVLQPDGKILASGAFSNAGGVARSGFARINADGSLDAAFNPVGSDCYDIVLQPDGKILGVGSDFARRFNATNGSLDATFAPNPDSFTGSVAVQADGKIVLGGFFSNIGGQARSKIARFHPDGTLDTTFNPGANNTVRTLAIQPDGRILASGYFTTMAGTARNGLARLHLNGTLDASLAISSASIVRSVAVQADFAVLASSARQGTTFQTSGPNGAVDAIAVQADGRILYGGAFTSLFSGANTRNRIARLNADFTIDTTFDPNANGQVMAVAVQADQKILAGGLFTGITGIVRNRVARLNANGTLDSGFNPDADNIVNALAAQSDGKIVMGGLFTTVGGVARNRIARLNADGTLDGSFNPDASGTVYSLAIQPDGKILVGGSFGSVGGQTRLRVARLETSGALDTGFNPNVGTSGGTVYALALQTDGRIVIGGDFDSVGGQTRNRIARLESGGAVDASFNPDANDSVLSLAVQADGKVLAAGNFTSIGGQARTRIARLTNTGAALQNLQATVSSITWTRSGASPEVDRVTFESSSNGVVWTSLGAGTRMGTGSNWQLTGLSLPPFQNLFLRARGYGMTGGFGGGDSSAHESVRLVYLIPVPTVTTLAANGIFDTGVTLNATINPNSSTTSAQFQYGLTTSYGSSAGITLSPANGSTAQTVNASISGLAPNTLYHFRATATNSHGTTHGGDLTFTTLAGPNNAPTDISLSNASIAEHSVLNNTIGTLSATDPESSQSHTFALVGGAGSTDNSAFTISDGTLRINGTADYETKNSYAIRIRATDNGVPALSDEEAFTITITDINEAPVITSNGGGMFASLSIAENTTAVTTVTATDPDIGQTKTFTLSSSADQAMFSIDSSTGVLSFIAAPDFEAPADAGGDNVYEVTVQVADNGTSFPLADQQFLFITVTNAVPDIVLGATNIAENNTPNATVGALGVTEPGSGLSYSFALVAGTGSTDNAAFTISGSTLRINASADYETQNSYAIRVRATDNGGPPASVERAFLITVSNVNEAPVITSSGGGATGAGSVPENTTSVTTVTATDVDPGQTRIFSISGGADQAKFSIVGSTGVLSFAAAPDFEAPTDAGANNVYEVTVQVTDNGTPVLTDTQALSITVTGVNEAPVITSSGGGAAGTVSVPENTNAVTTVTASDVDAGQTKTFSISGGADQAKFSIVAGTGALSFNAAPDFEAPTDAGANNVYEVTVQVTDNGTPALNDTQTLSITVTNANEAPVINSNGGGATGSVSVPENTTAVTMVTASDVDAGQTRIFSISGGADQAWFSIGSSTGVLSFVVTPNFEAPTDAGANNVYEVTVQVTDNGAPVLTDTQALSITVTGVNEAPVITSNGAGPIGGGNIPENTTAVTTVTVTDVDAGQTKTYSIAGGADQAKFSITAGTGALSFVSAPDFETRADAGANNIYEVTVQVTDNGTPALSDTQALSIAVTNVNEAPVITSSGGGATGAVSVPENTAAVTTITATDADAGQTKIFSITGGADQAKFSINATTGELSFVAAPDFEAPADAGANNVYDVTVQVTDNGTPALNDTQALSVTVIDAFDARSPADDGFDPDANSVVNAILTEPNGNIIVTGQFTGIGGRVRNRIARLNAAGAADPAFDPNVANATVSSAVLQADGRIVIGGSFTTVGGQTRNRLARLNTDGTLDFGFNPAPDNSVGAVAIQADGKILAGGSFLTIAGQTRNRIARLNADGSLDSGFDPNVSDGNISVIAVDANGKILLGGSFTTVGGQTRNRIARLNPDGTLDATFDPNSSGSVTGLFVQADGQILAGGGFATIGGQSRANIARLNPDGTADSWNPGAIGAASVFIQQTDGRIVAGGSFTTIGGQTRNRMARFNVDGTLDGTFNPNAGSTVAAMALQSDGKLLVGGLFTSIGSQARNRIARLEADGTVETTLNPDADGGLLALAVQSDGKILAGGLFSAIGGQPRNRIARLNTDGAADAGFNPGANNTVHSLAVQADGKILVAGEFTGIAAQTRNSMARLNADGTLDTLFDPNPSGTAFALTVQADGKILAGGSFTGIGGQPRNRIARLLADGTAEIAFNPDANGAVRTLAVQADGKILAGGDFTMIGGVTRSHIARLHASGALDTGFNPGANGLVFALTMQADGKILLGGAFTSIGGQTRSRLARLNPDGTLDGAFDPNADSDVLCLALQADGKILAGGQFTSIGGQSRDRIARLNANGTADNTFVPGAGGSVNVLTMQADGKVLAGGQFTSAGGLPRNHVACLANPDAALQNLSAAPATVTWSRGLASPHVDRVTFESSPDGAAWTSLGAGTRTGAGSDWQLTGLSLPAGQRFLVRARGYPMTGGLNGGDASVYESVRLVYPAAAPLTPVQLWRQTWFGTPANAGNAANSFDFDHDGLTNEVEYALGFNPTQPSTAGLPIPVLTGAPGNRRLALEILLPAPVPPEVRLEVFGGNSPGTAGESVALRPSGGAWTGDVTPISGGVRVNDTRVYDMNQRRFLWLTVTLVP